jgi:hypothetical protein
LNQQRITSYLQRFSDLIRLFSTATYYEDIMRGPRVILDFRDALYRPTRRTIADGLAKLELELGSKPETGRCYLHARRQSIWGTRSVSIWYRPTEGDDIVIAYPWSKGCWARTTSGTRIYVSLDELDGALLDEDGHVSLGDGRTIHAVEFDILPHPEDFADLGHAIVLLTVRFLKAEATCFRCVVPEVGCWAIDYSRVPELSVRNVKELARYIDARIGSLPRHPGDPPFGPVPLAKIQSTLALAGIRKVRGRKPKMAA